MRIKPLGDRALIKPITEEKRTEGGLVLPDTSKEKPQKAEVIAIGKLEDVDLNVGDRIIFSKYAGTEIKIDGEDYILIDSGDILGLIEG
ncbi:MAG TPA: co-chaperone GroES [Thermotogota bacterium]|nr:co-chaperone GroES [Thermotogota bacterium]HRW34263.1 co-chaperone GroES [Thermotogota bacterium]